MSKNQRLGTSLALVAAAGVILLFSVKTKKEKKRRLHEVAEEGYETAHDVLYPLKFKRGNRRQSL
jgi:hypothetical protein